MPLTLKAPNKQDFMPLLHKLERRLDGWKTRFISRAGKLQLVRTVLSVIPTYYMSCFPFPKWLTKRIDSIRRNFLWSRNETTHPIHLINWHKVCLPIANGGLGVLDLRLHNMSLLLRWWWRLLAADAMLWKSYAVMIYAAQHTHDAPLTFTNSGSFFWKYILKLRPLFFSCTQFQLNSGKQVGFWNDGWAGQPLAYDASRPLYRRSISVTEAKSCFYRLLPTPLTLHQHLAHERLQNFVPTTEDDRLLWLLSPSGRYSAHSVYTILSQGGKTLSTTRSFWKSKVTPSMLLFFFFLLDGKLLTHEVMLKRHLTFTPGCVLCDQRSHETTMHLFFGCPFSHQIWSGISSLAGYSIMNMQESPLLTYTGSAPVDTNARCAWSVLFITATWFIWRERNNRTFRQMSTPNHILLSKIMQEAALCLRYC